MNFTHKETPRPMRKPRHCRKLITGFLNPYYRANLWQSTRKLLALLRCSCYRSCLCRGVAAAIEHEAVLLQQSARTVIDIGANRGQFAVVARRVWPRVSILAFEPIDDARQVMETVFFNDPLFRAYPVALGSREGTAVLHLSRHEPASSLLPIGPQQAHAFPGTEAAGVRVVPIHRLDRILQGQNLEKPVLCKIDVQGTEKEVLEGMGTVSEQIDILLIEASFVEFYVGQSLFSDLLPWLGCHEFGLDGLYDAVTDDRGNVTQCNCLLRRRSSSAKRLLQPIRYAPST